jgi:hypothetical protein
MPIQPDNYQRPKYRTNVMNIKEIGLIAKDLGIKPKRFKKAELIHSIQRNEGNFDCFATAYDGECDQVQCAWRGDCLPHSLKKVD